MTTQSTKVDGYAFDQSMTCELNRVIPLRVSQEYERSKIPHQELTPNRPEHKRSSLMQTDMIQQNRAASDSTAHLSGSNYTLTGLSNQHRLKLALSLRTSELRKKSARNLSSLLFHM